MVLEYSDYDVSEYLIKHQDGIKSYLLSVANNARTNPILTSYLNEAIVNEVIHIVAIGLSRCYEDIATIITHEYLVELLGQEFFKWQKNMD